MDRSGHVADDSKRVFHLHEKVYVYQGPLLYEAKIMRTFDPVIQKMVYFDEKKKENVTTQPGKKFPIKMLSEVCYMVHYQGWNVKWDEWVLPERILEINSINTMHKDNLQFQVQEEERLKQEALVEAERLKQVQKEMEKSKKKISKNGKDSNIYNEDGTRKRKMVKLTLNGSGIESIINGNGKASVEFPKKAKRGRPPKERLNDSGSSTPDDMGTMANLNLSGLRQQRRPGGGDGMTFGIGAGATGATGTRSTFYESQTGFTHREIKEFIPDELKIVLVDDWENITKNNKLVSLPVGENGITVRTVMDDFTCFLKDEFPDRRKELELLLEITESIKIYFEQCVGCFLLYRYERPQYNELIEVETEKKLCDFYDPIFLLRLLSIFPNILMMNEVEDPGTIKVCKTYLDIILHWLVIRKDYYFQTEYENQIPWISIMNG